MNNAGAFLMASAAVIVVPGAATLFVGAKAQAGPLQAMAGAAGVVLGDVMLMSASGLGLSSLVTRWPVLLAAIRLLGASYIGWIGLSLIRSGEPQLQDAGVKQGPVATTAKEGLLLTLVNPKPILFFAAFFPMFIQAKIGSWAANFAWLGVLYETLNIAYFTALIAMITRLRQTGLFRRAHPKRLQLVSGLCLLACAVLVLLSSIPRAGV
jgi:leucine efflux protein